MKNYKLIHLIKEKIAISENGGCSFAELVATLENMILELEEVSTNLKNNLITEWWELEQLNAHILSQDNYESKLTDYLESHGDDINNAFTAIISLLDQALNNPSNAEGEATPIGNGWFICPFCTESWQVEAGSKFSICPSCNKKLLIKI
ncbi:MAG: hypothetical protein HQK53_13295 [Oligoflexia bacterium]|nr:hypothetical protein [Oligoflexia bacterium]